VDKKANMRNMSVIEPMNHGKSALNMAIKDLEFFKQVVCKATQSEDMQVKVAV
jgi:translation elongation factor EF-4